MRAGQEETHACEFECSDVIPGCHRKVTRDAREDTVEEIERDAEEAPGMADLPDDLTKTVLALIQTTN